VSPEKDGLDRSEKPEFCSGIRGADLPELQFTLPFVTDTVVYSFHGDPLRGTTQP
jgi:hypothetical protein